MNYSQLKDCTIVYQVTCLPDILFSSLTPATNVYQFNKEDFIIPKHLSNLPIEIRIAFYTNEGKLIDLSSTMAFSQTLVSLLNIIPLKMIDNLLTNP
jgi:hypothetical protein